MHRFRYGGPGSQLTDLKFNRDWDHYVACGLKYIVVTVDGRGTGFKGRSLMNPVKDNLGFFETKDQINAAKSVDFPTGSKFRYLQSLNL
jgi:dipeptidyl aminopeptidase